MGGTETCRDCAKLRMCFTVTTPMFVVKEQACLWACEPRQSSNLNKCGCRGRGPCRRSPRRLLVGGMETCRDCAKLRMCFTVTTHARGEGAGQACLWACEPRQSSNLYKCGCRGRGPCRQSLCRLSVGGMETCRDCAKLRMCFTVTTPMFVAKEQGRRVCGHVSPGKAQI